MSCYTNYDEKAASYELSRRPAGVDIISAILPVYRGKSLKDMHVLDAGCGTGNYSKALFDSGVGRLSMLDASGGMLQIASQKFERTNGKVHIQQSVLPCLPYADGVFDAVMFNMVLHHLDQTGETAIDFPMIKMALKQANRVLNPGGLAIISTSLPQHYTEGYWFSKLNPSIANRFQRRFPSIEEWRELVKGAQLNWKTAVSLMDSDWFQQYHDVEGPLREKWRNNDSYWSFATKEELMAVEDKVRQLMKEGRLQDFKKEHDNTVALGHVTIIFALKE